MWMIVVTEKSTASAATRAGTDFSKTTFQFSFVVCRVPTACLLDVLGQSGSEWGTEDT